PSPEDRLSHLRLLPRLLRPGTSRRRPESGDGEAREEPRPGARDDRRPLDAAGEDEGEPDPRGRTLPRLPPLRPSPPLRRGGSWLSPSGRWSPRSTAAIAGPAVVATTRSEHAGPDRAFRIPERAWSSRRGPGCRVRGGSMPVGM